MRLDLFRRPARAALHQLPVPASGPRHRRPACLGGGPEKRGEAKDARAFLHEATQSSALAPLPLDLQGSRGFRPRHHLPPVGERHRQLSPLGYGPRGVEVGDMAPYPRHDLQHVANRSQRPTDADYDRYLWLLIKKAGCDERSIYSYHPFLVKDVLFSAILMAANEALLEIAALVSAHDEDRARIADWIDRGRRGLQTCRDPEHGLCFDHDLRAGKPLRVCTVAGFAPLIAGRQSLEQVDALIATLDSPAFLGHPWLRWPVPPSTSPFQEGFHRCSYWRGPTWPVVNWLLWWSLLRAGKAERAERGFGKRPLQQIVSSGFGEYFDPFTGEHLGATEQSWTAAVALDWLANEPRRGERRWRSKFEGADHYRSWT